MSEETKVLVIDDDEVDRMTLRRALKKSEISYILTECNEAASAMELLKDHTYDCIFLDYLLPGTDGLMLLRKLRTDGIKTPIIIITSQGDEKVAVEMMKSGASDYIVKTQIDPLNIKKIIQSATRLGEIERQREEAEKALKISEARLSQAQKIARIGNWEFNFRTSEVYWSEEMYNIFEVDPKHFKLEHDHYKTLIHPEEREEFRELMKKSASSGEHINKDLRAILPDGTFKFINVQAYYEFDHRGEKQKLVGTVQDVNQRKIVESQLIEARMAAEESGKIKEQFLANMSHEIRTPMNAIIGFTNLMIGQDNFSPEQKKYIRAIHDAGEHLMVIINDILDFSKIQSGKMVIEKLDFSLPELVEKVINLFRQKADEKGIQLSYTIEENVPMHLTGDPVRLNQVLVNLISNAVKFTENGYVKLGIRHLTTTDSMVRVRITAEDTGIGVPEEKLNTIFESFTQASNDTTRKYGGTGLGLTIVKKIIELQHGSIAVQSKPGQGTVFVVDLPFERSISDSFKGKRSTENAVTAEAPADYPRDIRVLMAEDNELNQTLAASVFRKIGWHLDIAGNGKIAIEKLGSGHYDILLMDIQMPEMDGYTATLKIRNELSLPASQIPIMAITAHALNSEVKKCLDAGMNDYIAKPFKIEDLIRKVTSLVKKDSDVKPAETGVSEKVQAVHSQMIDMENLFEMSGNSPETVSTIISLFLSQAPEKIEELQSYLREKNWQEMKMLCHKMKSSYALLGVRDLRKYMEVIEEDCMQNAIDMNKFELLVSSIVKQNAALVSELQGILSAQKLNRAS